MTLTEQEKNQIREAEPLTIATRDVAFITMAMIVGFRVALLRDGEFMRIRIFSHTNNNGAQQAASRDTVMRIEEGLKELAARYTLPVKMRRDGADILIGRLFRKESAGNG